MVVIFPRTGYHNMSEEKNQKLKEYQKIIMRLGSLNLVINETVFWLYKTWKCMLCFSYTLLNT